MQPENTNAGKLYINLFDNCDIKKSFSNMSSINMKIARVVDDPKVSSLGAGFIELKNEGFEWKLYYDEIIYVIDGELTIKHKKHEYKAKPGEIISLHKGVEIVYSAEEYAKFFYVIYPVNWRQIENIQ